MRLSIIIPAFNEEKTVRRVIEKVNELDLSKEIIVVDDGSQDRTGAILADLQKELDFKIFIHRENKGKGAAIKTGVREAKGDYLIIQDADLEYDPRQILKLLKVARKQNASVVYGSRFEGQIKKMTLSSRVGNRFLTFLTNFLFGCRLTDMETCYKLFKREIIQSINWKAKSFDFEPEITVRILKKGIKIYEEPITYTARKANEGKKITWRDGIKAAALLLRLRLFN